MPCDQTVEHAFGLPGHVDDTACIVVQCSPIHRLFASLGGLFSGWQENKCYFLALVDFYGIDRVVDEDFDCSHAFLPFRGRGCWALMM